MKRVPEEIAIHVDRYLEIASPKTNFEAALAHLLKRGLEAEGIDTRTDATAAKPVAA